MSARIQAGEFATFPIGTAYLAAPAALPAALRAGNARSRLAWGLMGAASASWGTGNVVRAYREHILHAEVHSLGEMGCQGGQGYLLSRPMEYPRVAAFLAAPADPLLRVSEAPAVIEETAVR